MLQDSEMIKIVKSKALEQSITRKQIHGCAGDGPHCYIA